MLILEKNLQNPRSWNLNNLELKMFQIAVHLRFVRKKLFSYFNVKKSMSYGISFDSRNAHNCNPYMSEIHTENSHIRK